LSHISRKFGQPVPKVDIHEPRAALFLNRFTRTLTIMYATSGLEEVLGIPAETMRGKSFYYCIAENCLTDAVKCLETAKGNNSIAYLRFWFRDPRTNNDPFASGATDESDEEMTTDTSVDQDYSGGVDLGERSGEDHSSSGEDSHRSNAVRSDTDMDMDDAGALDPQSRTSSGDSTNPRDTHEAIFGTAARREASSVSSASLPPSPDDMYRHPLTPAHTIELEAVISCASDGLVVCLRRARPMIPQPNHHRPTQQSTYENGLFAAPWGEEPIFPPVQSRSGFERQSNFAPSLSPYSARKPAAKAGGPDSDDFMTAIRSQAIFAWALTGINGAMHNLSSGTPRGESVPEELRVWTSDKSSSSPAREERTDSASSGVDGMKKPMHKPTVHQHAYGNDHRKLFGDPGLFANHHHH